jgi:hypothetical protein
MEKPFSVTFGAHIFKFEKKRIPARKRHETMFFPMQLTVFLLEMMIDFYKTPKN